MLFISDSEITESSYTLIKTQKGPIKWVLGIHLNIPNV